jgi:hypothetical protein
VVNTTLASAFPIDTLKQVAAPKGLTLTYYKFDALIAACAIRYSVSMLVTLDDGVEKLLVKAQTSLKAVQPGFFQSQVSLAPAPTLTAVAPAKN